MCAALLDPGDVVLVEKPTYAPAVKVLRAHGAIVAEVESDRDGVLPEALASAFERHRPALVYLLPTIQNPTGRTMPASRRRAVGEVIRRYEVTAVEDDVYFDLRYRGVPAPTLWSFAPDHTVYLTSLSKTIAPALRIGITVLPDGLVEPVLALKQGIDMQTPSFGQAIAAGFLSAAWYPERLRQLVGAYRSKLTAMTEALGRHLPPGYTSTDPDGGLFVWVEGPPGFDADATLTRALEAGVAYVPGCAFFAGDDPERRGLRLSFSAAPLDRIDRGVELLVKARVG